MNILIAATQLKHSNGGVCTHIIDLCKDFCKTEKVVLVADGTDYAQQLAGIEGLTYIELPFGEMDRNKKSIWKCFIQLRNVCKDHRIQIMHLHGQRLIPIAWLVRATMGIPFLWTNHIDAIPGKDLLRKMWRIMRFPIISVSSALKTQLIEELGVDGDRISVVNNGVDIAALQPLTETEKCNIIKKFGIKPDAIVVSEVARLTPVKGQHLLVRAISALKQKMPDLKVQVLLAGSGDMAWFQKAVLDYAKENGIDCSYLGFCKPRDVYGVSDLAVLSSSFEGFSLSSVEALALGCPVLRSKSPGYDEMKDVVLGCEINDLESLTEQLEFAVTHIEQMRRTAAQGQILVKEKFSKEEMSRNTLAVYYQIVGSGKFSWRKG